VIEHSVECEVQRWCNIEIGHDLQVSVFRSIYSGQFY